MDAERPVITDENETVIQCNDKGPDGLGRRQFSAYWLADNTGPSCDQVGVRGQAFFANVDEFVARHRARGRTVRVLDAPPDTKATRQAGTRRTPAVVDVSLPELAEVSL